MQVVTNQTTQASYDQITNFTPMKNLILALGLILGTSSLANENNGGINP